MSSLYGSSAASEASGFGLGADAGPAGGPGGESVAKSAVIAGTRLVFELEWSPTQDRSAPEAEFQRARKLGYNFATLLPDKSLVGLAKGVQPAPGKPHAAVVMLVERFSSGGAEAVLLAVGNRVAFVGLMDRRPVPGFDRLLSGVEAALALLKEFRDIHIDQEVRVATDLRDLIPNSETLQTHTLFEMPESSSLVRPLVNRALRRTVAAGLVAGVAAVGGLGSYLWSQYQERRAAEEAARLAQEADPNRLYERGLPAMLASAGIPGNEVLDLWRQQLERVPLTREGWALQRFECSQASPECTATWTRNYGSFQAFLDSPPPGAMATQLVPPGSGGEVLASAITTRHVWDTRKMPEAAQGGLRPPAAAVPAHGLNGGAAGQPQSVATSLATATAGDSSSVPSAGTSPVAPGDGTDASAGGPSGASKAGPPQGTTGSSASGRVTPPASPHGLSRASLPLADTVTERWGSWLQDLSLAAGLSGGSAGSGANGTVTSLKPARLFGPSTVTELTRLRQPVVAMEWRIADGVWSLPSVDLPPSAVPESLTVQLNAGQISYILSGYVYAKGKSY